MKVYKINTSESGVSYYERDLEEVLVMIKSELENMDIGTEMSVSVEEQHEGFLEELAEFEGF